MQVLRCPFLRDQALRCENHRNKTDLHLIFAGDPICFLPSRLVLHLEKEYTVHSIYIYIYTIHSFQEIGHSVFVDGWDLVPCQGRTFLCRWQALRNAVFGWPLSISLKSLMMSSPAARLLTKLHRSEDPNKNTGAVRKKQRWLEPFPAARLTYGFLGIAILGSFSCIGRGVSLAYSTGNCCFFVARGRQKTLNSGMCLS